MTNDLDTLLSQPLDAVTDDGFSARVMTQLIAQQTWSERLLALVPIAGVCALVPFLPLRETGAAMAHLGPSVAHSGAISLAVAALILTYLADSRLRNSF